MKEPFSKRKDGSLRDHLCSNTGPATTASSSSTREVIKTIDPVPLYLVPPVVTSAVNGGAHVWLDRDRDPDPPDDDTFAPGMHRDGTENVQRTGTEERPRSTYSREKRERSLSHSTLLHQNRRTPGTPDRSGSRGVCVCDRRPDAHDGNDGGESQAICNPDQNISPFIDNTGVQAGAIRCTRATGSRTLMLPGVLDHREFTRVNTDLGRCDVCDEGKAVHRSADGQVVLCEGCYARLVQAWNAGRGISCSRQGA